MRDTATSKAERKKSPSKSRRPGESTPRSKRTPEVQRRTRRLSLTPDEVFKAEAGRQASRHSKAFENNSSLVQKRTRRITELRWSDLEVGRMLGKGSFSRVYEVKVSAKGEKRDKLSELLHDSSGRNDAGEVLANDSERSRDMWDLISTDGIETVNGKNDATVSFALKHLRPREDHDRFTHSAIDLVLEAKLLSCLNHDNIIKLYGVTEGSISKSFRRKGYFLLLDRLDTTLDRKLLKWAGRERELAYDKPKRLGKLEERLKSVAVGIARGMSYLHENKIIFRDLKPTNVGFTTTEGNSSGGEGVTKNRRTVKIFDFGLAREVEKDPNKKMTGYTGSARYMAPEVARGHHYGLNADVYSYGILLWEVCTLTKAFRRIFTKEDYVSLVVGAQLRPKIQSVEGSNQLKKLIQSCWNHNPAKRPTFEGVLNALYNELNVPETPTKSRPKRPGGFLRRQNSSRLGTSITKWFSFRNSKD